MSSVLQQARSLVKGAGEADRKKAIWAGGQAASKLCSVHWHPMHQDFDCSDTAGQQSEACVAAPLIAAEPDCQAHARLQGRWSSHLTLENPSSHAKAHVQLLVCSVLAVTQQAVQRFHPATKGTLDCAPSLQGTLMGFVRELKGCHVGGGCDVGAGGAVPAQQDSSSQPRWCLPLGLGFGLIWAHCWQSALLALIARALVQLCFVSGNSLATECGRTCLEEAPQCWSGHPATLAWAPCSSRAEHCCCLEGA